MIIKTIQKSLAGLEDLLFGKGIVQQERNGNNYPITKLSLVWSCDSLAELADVNKEKFTQAIVAGVNYRLVGNAWVRADTVLVRSVAELTSAMAAGSPVSLAFYDDSTGDGFATTGWTANPTSGGEALGNTNHNLTSPNAYPTKLEAILRDMYGNNNIRTFNAGYAGKSIADGWALRNFEQAILSNPYYGLPTATFIGFGLNDVRPAGSQLQEFREQLEALIDKVISFGSLPILLTADPIMRNYNVTNAIYNREVLLQIDEVRREVAKNKKVPLIEKGELVRAWANNNADGYRWFIEQSTDVDNDGDFGSGDDVGLHFRDVGHSIKAQCIAKSLFPATVEYADAFTRVTSNDARAKCFGNFLLTLSGDNEANSTQGFNYKVDFYDANLAHRPETAGAAMSTMWVWNSGVDCNLVYRGLVGEGWGTDNPDNVVANILPPKIAVSDLTTGNVDKYIPASVGFRYSGFYKPSDVPFTVCKLKHGLSKIEYQCGDFSQYNQGSTSLFLYGFFELTKTATPTVQFSAIDTSVSSSILDCTGFDQPIGIVDSRVLTFLLDVDLPVGCGVSVLSSSTFAGLGVGIPDGFGSLQASVLYRHSATSVRLAVVKKSKQTGGIISLPINVAVTAPFAGSRLQVRLDITRTYGVNDYGQGSQVVKLYSGWDNNISNLLQTTTIPTTVSTLFHFGGQVGGFYSNPALNTNGGTIVIRSLNASIAGV